jgi:tryptophan-rich sensory protein
MQLFQMKPLAPSAMHKLAGLIAWLFLTFAAAGFGAAASRNAPEFYGALVQPSWAPPASAFGPVWTVLYLLMAIAAWLVWSARGFRGAKVPLGLFIAQLAANALWSWAFFVWHSGKASLADITILLTLIVAVTIGFWRIHRTAGILMLPYLLWVGFAAALNFVLWRSNPELL